MSAVPRHLCVVLEPLRNGADGHFRYIGRLCISDGAREAAGAAECYWIFDLLSSEVAPLLAAKTNDGTFLTSILTVSVVDSHATLEVAGQRRRAAAVVQGGALDRLS
jgi:hypothetical protein